jgi:hypothetical protein
MTIVNAQITLADDDGALPFEPERPQLAPVSAERAAGPVIRIERVPTGYTRLDLLDDNRAAYRQAVAAVEQRIALLESVGGALYRADAGEAVDQLSDELYAAGGGSGALGQLLTAIHGQRWRMERLV